MMAVAPVAGLFSASTAKADNWLGVSGNWNNINNWDGGIPGAGVNIVFTGSTANNATTDDIASTTVFGTILFDATAASYSITGTGSNTLSSGDITDSSTNVQNISIGVALTANRNIIGTAGSSIIFNNAITGTGFGITASGGGSTTFNAANTYSGVTVLNGGSTTYNADNSMGILTFGPTPTATVGSISPNVTTLVLNTGNVTSTGITVQTGTTLLTPDVVTIGTGKVLTINGGFTAGVPSAASVPISAGVVTAVAISGNTFTVNGTTANFQVGLGRTNAAAGTDPRASVDMSGLANFTYTGTTGQFVVGGGNVLGNVALANTTNNITAAQIRVGDSQASGEDNNPNNGAPSTLHLGKGTNVLNVTTIIIGNDKGDGVIDFQDPVLGSVNINGIGGATTTADITMGTYINGASSNTPIASLLLAGHTATVNAGNVSVGILNGTGTGAGTNDTGCITFDTGTFNAAKITLGSSSLGGNNSLNNVAAGTFILGSSTSASTGILTVGSLVLGNRTNGNVTSGRVNATFTINSGTANLNGNIIDASTTTSTSVTVNIGGFNNTNLNLLGGALNMNGHNIGTYASPIANINLTGGSLTGAATIAGRNITVGAGVTITGSPNYVLADAGVLTLAGPLNLSGGGGLGGGGSTNVGTVNGGDVTLNAGTTLAPGSSTVTGTLTVNGNVTLNSNAGTFKFGPGINDIVNVNGNLTLTGSIPLSFPALGTGPTAGNYTIMSYTGTLTGSETNFGLGSNTTRFNYSVNPTAGTPGIIQVQVSGTGPDNLIYVGNGSSNWDLKTTSDFKDGLGNTQQFFTLDNPTFDDSSTNLAPVQIIGTLNPGSVAVTNTLRDYTFAGTGSVTGAVLTKDGTGNLTITNDNSLSAVTITNGTLILGSGGTTGSAGSGITITDNANLTINHSGPFTFNNVVTGTGNVSYNGTGTTTLTATGNYTGSANINTGIIKVTSSASLGSTTGTLAPVNIASGATLDLGGDLTANDAALNYQGKVFTVAGTGVGGVGAITNTGVSQFNAFNNITLAADTTFSGFRFDIGRTTAGSQLNLAGHTLTLNMDAPSASLFAILANATVSSGNIVVNSGGISIEKTASVLDDGGVSSITYGTGTFAFFYQTSPTNTTRNMIFKGGNTIGSGNGTLASISDPMSLQGNVTLEPMLNGVPDTTDNFPLTLNGSITESGGSFGITKLGVDTNVLSGSANVWSGASAVNAGTLEFAPNAVTGTSTSSIGSVSGTGGGNITIDALATVTSGGIQTNAPLTINGGLQVRNAATPSVSKVSSLTLGGTYGGGGATDTTSVWTGSLDLTNSKFIVEDTSLNRPADITLLKNQTLTANTAGGTVGIFSSTANAANIAAGKIVKVVAVSDNAVRMATFPAGSTNFGGVNNVDASSILIAAVFKGDANMDGVVDIQDLTDVANHWQQTVTDWSQGDFDGSNFVDIQDLTAVANNWQAGVGAGGGQSFSDALAQIGGFKPAATPEPASLALLGLGGLVLTSRRRKNVR